MLVHECLQQQNSLSTQDDNNPNILILQEQIGKLWYTRIFSHERNEVLTGLMNLENMLRIHERPHTQLSHLY